MRNEHKTAFQKDRIMKLRHENASLKEEIHAMSIRNDELQKENAQLAETMANMKDHHDTLMEEYRASIEDAKNAKAKFEKLIAEVRVARREYEKQVTELIHKIAHRK